MKKMFLSLLFVFCSVNLMAQVAEDEYDVKNLYKFYKWYIEKSNKLQTADFNPQVEKGDKGYALLNIDAYCEAIKNSGYFTNGFIESEKTRLQPCADKIAKMKYADYKKIEMGGFPEECNCFYYDRWFNAQDNPDRMVVARTRSLTENSDEAFFVFETGDEKNVEQWTTKQRAIMKLEEGSWRIDALEFK